MENRPKLPFAGLLRFLIQYANILRYQQRNPAFFLTVFQKMLRFLNNQFVNVCATVACNGCSTTPAQYQQTYPCVVVCQLTEDTIEPVALPFYWRWRKDSSNRG